MSNWKISQVNFLSILYHVRSLDSLIAYLESYLFRNQMTLLLLIIIIIFSCVYFPVFDLEQNITEIYECCEKKMQFFRGVVGPYLMVLMSSGGRPNCAWESICSTRDWMKVSCLQGKYIISPLYYLPDMRKKSLENTRFWICTPFRMTMKTLGDSL